MSFCNYLEANVLNHVFGAVAYTVPTVFYVGLCTSVSEAGTITGEPTIGVNGYARVAVTNNDTNWPTVNDGSKSNGDVIIFPEASGPWGALTTFFLSDAASGNSNTLVFGTLTVEKSPTAGDTIKFNVGELVITLD